MKAGTMLRNGMVLVTIASGSAGLYALRTEAAAQKCPHGVVACSAERVGQPCNPNNLNIICSKQSGNRYCCLAYAP